ncbi:MAG: hypothetical protein CMK09_05635 [Ponticaulis sp.]|nr:hypothetical protein [Ponticaulis sp.]|tara:strand:+ start:33215 stop:33682 length:468 start_codon:yes stop_codon:yes gene_type:complete
MKTIETGPRIDDLGISESTLAAIILKAKNFDAMVPESDPVESSNASDDREIDMLEDQPDNPARQVLEQSINGLSDEQKETLVALTWVGRGDYDVVEWEDAKAKASARKDSTTSYYLSGIPLLGDYLETGAAALGIPVTGAETEILTHDQNLDPVD